MADKLARYPENPALLIDMVDHVLKKYSQIKPVDVTEEKIIQYSEISKTIDRLKESGASVPDDLRRIKIALSHDVDSHDKYNKKRNDAIYVLKMLELRLSNSLTTARSIITKLASGNSQAQRNKRYVKRTSPTILAKEIRKALRELGGEGKKSEVLKKIQANMDGKFKPNDLEIDNNGMTNWERWVVFEKNKMVREGILKTGSKFGIWELRRK